MKQCPPVFTLESAVIRNRWNTKSIAHHGPKTNWLLPHTLFLLGIVHLLICKFGQKNQHASFSALRLTEQQKESWCICVDDTRSFCWPLPHYLTSVLFWAIFWLSFRAGISEGPVVGESQQRLNVNKPRERDVLHREFRQRHCNNVLWPTVPMSTKVNTDCCTELSNHYVVRRKLI